MQSILYSHNLFEKLGCELVKIHNVDVEFFDKESNKQNYIEDRGHYLLNSIFCFSNRLIEKYHQRKRILINVNHLFDKFIYQLSDSSDYGVTLVNLNSRNIIIDDQSFEFSGFIDFEYLRIENKDRDFVFLQEYSSRDKYLKESFLKGYKSISTEFFLI